VLHRPVEVAGAKQPLHHCGIKGKFGSIPERPLSSIAVIQGGLKVAHF